MVHKLGWTGLGLTRAQMDWANSKQNLRTYKQTILHIIRTESNNKTHIISTQNPTTKTQSSQAALQT